MRNFILAFLMLISTGCCTVAAAGTPIVQSDRAVVLSGVVTGRSLAPIAASMLKLASTDKSAPIDLIISSPGGEVASGFLFINIMDSLRARGTTIRCFVPTLAASMAFQILLHCDERYTLDHSWLLWHRVRVSLGGGLLSGGTTLTGPQASVLARDLETADDMILRELRYTLDMSDDEISYHFDNETLHIGQNLHTMAPHFIQSYPAIPGLLEVLEKASGSRGADDRAVIQSFPPGVLIYIYTGGAVTK